MSVLLALSGRRRIIAEQFNRPNDANAYAARDWVSNATSNAARMIWEGATLLRGGTGVITAATLSVTDTTWVARLRLHLWASPHTPGNDNAAAARDKDADLAFYVGHLTFQSPVTEGAGDEFAYDQQQGIYLPYYCAAGGNALYGQLETLDAVAMPVAQTTYRVVLTLELDG